MMADAAGRDTPRWRVGALARATGLSVRTLHHYDQIGLLTPRHHTAGGHRIYTCDDVARLTCIVVLRRAGLTLAEIGERLSREIDEADLTSLIEQRVRSLEASMIDTRSFARSLVGEPFFQVAGDPDRLRQIGEWAPPQRITSPPVILLVYADVEQAQHRLVEMFGFGPGPISRRPDGTTGFAEVVGPIGNIRLHAPRPGLGPPDPRADPSSMITVGVADLQAHLDRAQAGGASIVRPISLQFGRYDYLALDHERHLWCFQDDSELPA